jgi:hypothetical protein
MSLKLTANKKIYRHRNRMYYYNVTQYLGTVPIGFDLKYKADLL